MAAQNSPKKPMAAKTPSASQPSIKQSLQSGFTQWLEPWKNKAVNFAKDWEKFKDILKSNYDLGQAHLRKGNIQDAILRFRFVIWLDPKYEDVWYFLGCSYLANEELRMAKSSLVKALKQNPANHHARYVLALIMGKDMPSGELPKIIPQDLLIEQFDTMAETFDAQQIGEMEYEGHVMLCNALRAGLTPGRTDYVALDLGAGTGLCGPLLRDVALHLTAVDFSPEMLEQARKLMTVANKPVYDAVLPREVLEFIADGPSESYDIIMAAALVGYIGDLETLFEHCARILKPGGLFGLTADYLESGSIIFDAELGRFRHSQAYATDLAARFGLEEFRCRQGKVYPESAGLLCVFRKP